MRTLSVRNPRTGARQKTIGAYNAQDIQPVVHKLRAAQKSWQSRSMPERGEVLLKFAATIEAHRDPIAAALEVDTGRRRISRIEADGVARSLQGWVQQVPGLLPEGWTPGRSQPHLRHAPHFVPFGCVGVISPWNFPLTLSMIDTIPALLAGASVVIKPSEVTPRFVEPLRRAVADAGLEDVLAVITGDGATGAALIDQVDAICFTGSVATGRKVAAAAAARMIPAFLELGGKDPLIVTASANLDHASEAAFRGSVLSTGQACQSIERIYVHDSIADDLVARLTAKARAARLKWPDIGAGDLGPIIFERQATSLTDHISDALSKGAQCVAGGEIEHHGSGLCLRPTVLTNVDHSMKVMTEETFGPILPVMTYSSIDDAIALANDTEFGLSAAVFAGTLDEADAIGRRIDASGISLNDAALTGKFYEAEKHSFKLSGMGGGGKGPAGLQRFLRRKTLIANTAAPAPLAAYAEDAS